MEPTDLLTKAKHLTTIREGESYHWISPDELLIMRPVLTPPGCLGTWLPVAWIRARLTVHTAHRLTLSTGVETPLEEFNRLHTAYLPSRTTLDYHGRVETPYKSVYHDPPRVVVSPDGLWVLWERKEFLWRAATLDGSNTVDWPHRYECGYAAVWLPNSQEWLETISQYSFRRIRFRRLSDPEYEQIVALPESFSDRLVGITSQNTLLLHQWNHQFGWITLEEGNPLQESFIEIAYATQPVSLRRFTIPVPRPVFILQICVSPDGNRLAWLVEAGLDGRNLPYREFAIWVSKLDGTALQELGRARLEELPSDEIEGGTIYAYPREISWSLDGTRISFTYGREVLAVPVPPV